VSLVMSEFRVAPPAAAAKPNGLEEVLERIEVQSALEGLGARWAAERGISPAQARAVRACLREIDALLQTANASVAALLEYVRLDRLFHRSVLELAHCDTLSRYTEAEAATVLTVPEVTRLMTSNPERLQAFLLIEQDQHHRIVEAVESRMGARAESLVREHGRLARRHMTALA
jgi:GntR family transcriptional regulator, vanillate catabolism transcriptional regulator